MVPFLIVEFQIILVIVLGGLLDYSGQKRQQSEIDSDLMNPHTNIEALPNLNWMDTYELERRVESYFRADF